MKPELMSHYNLITVNVAKIKIGSMFCEPLLDQAGQVILESQTIVESRHLAKISAFAKLTNNKGIFFPVKKKAEPFKLTGLAYRLTAANFSPGIRLGYDIRDNKGNIIFVRNSTLKKQHIDTLEIIEPVFMVTNAFVFDNSRLNPENIALIKSFLHVSSYPFFKSFPVWKLLDNNILEIIRSNLNQDLQDLLRELKTKKKEQFHHSFDVALFCLMLIILLKDEIGIFYKNVKEFNSKASEFFFGGLLHDIGYLSLSENLLKKNQNQMSNDELLMLSSHAQKGYEYLQRNSRKIPGLERAVGDITKQCVLFHHERFDDRGYPTKLPYEGLPLSPKWISLIEVFDYLYRNSKRQANDLARIGDTLKGLINSCGSYLDVSIVSHFINKLGPYLLLGLPLFKIDDLVVLNSDEIAKVISINPKIILSPTIQVLYDSKGRTVGRNLQLDLQKDKRSIVKYLAPNRMDAFLDSVRRKYLAAH